MPALGEAIAKRQAERPHHGPRCGVGKLLDRIDPEQAKELSAALTSFQTPWRVLALAVEDVHGVRFDPTTLSRHARGMCLCRPLDRADG